MFLDNFLNTTTMYRLVLYCLLGILAVALLFSHLGILPHSPFLVAVGTIFLVLVSVFTNKILAWLLKAKVNTESAYITALILALIVAPIKDLEDWSYWLFLLVVALVAMVSKFVLVSGKKHIFNPAALAVTFTLFTMNQSAGWWVGVLPMAPFTLALGALVVKKTERFDLVFSFFVVALAPTLFGLNANTGEGLQYYLARIVFDSPILFFALIMLTEPLTTPPRRRNRIIYGALVGLLFNPSLHLGPIYSTPEIALLLGNLFSYAVSPKGRLVLKLKEKIQIADSVYDFIFTTDKKVTFKPGQYLEWTVSPEHSDTRGNRRYFTIASSPTEQDIRLGVKFYPNGSTFKKKLLALAKGETISASNLSGEFVMPEDTKRKLVFLAGGIGITPFRSMVKYLTDRDEKRDIIMIYSNRTAKDIAYRTLFSESEKKIGLRTVYTLTDSMSAGNVWNDRYGMVDAKMLKEEVPDFLEREFFLSGTHSMVVAFEKMLRGLGVSRSKIKKDFFPGYV